MKHIFAATALALSLAAASPAFANSSQKFESSLTTPVNAAVKVVVVIGNDLAYRANNLPKDLRDRGSSFRATVFSQNGYYGEKDLNRLADRLQEKTAARLMKEGVRVSDDASTVLRLVITDAQNNRPTFKQLSKEANLSYKSYGNGGAAIEGELLAADGQSLGEISYAWFERDIYDAAYSSTWSDAHRTLDRFARKAAKNMSE